MLLRIEEEIDDVIKTEEEIIRQSDVEQQIKKIDYLINIYNQRLLGIERRGKHLRDKTICGGLCTLGLFGLIDFIYHVAQRQFVITSLVIMLIINVVLFIHTIRMLFSYLTHMGIISNSHSLLEYDHYGNTRKPITLVRERQVIMHHKKQLKEKRIELEELIKQGLPQEPARNAMDEMENLLEEYNECASRLYGEREL